MARTTSGGACALGAYALLSLAAQTGPHMAGASIHEARGRLTGVRFTERMFADGRGPWGSSGRSTIAVNATLRALRDDEVADTITVQRLRDYFDFGVAVASFTDGQRFAQLNDSTVCETNFSDPAHGNVLGSLYGEFHLIDESHELTVRTVFHPTASGMQEVLLVPCWKQKDEAFGYPVSDEHFSMYPMTDPLLFMDVSVSFRNPYGYLPALLAGLYPFNGVLALLYGILGAIFSVLVYRHRESAIGLHYFVVAVLLLSVAESASWFFTFRSLNASGQPACCPFPGLVVLSTALRILAGMVARVATTLICLGYGILRPRISCPEVFVVSGLGLCYVIAVGALEVSHISNQADGDMRPPAVWEALVVTTNVCFGGWIFTSLALTRKNLAAFGQTAKLQMYTALHRVLFIYVLASFFLMAIEGAAYVSASRQQWGSGLTPVVMARLDRYSDALTLGWTSMWLVWAANRVLFLGLLAVMAAIWRPKPNSQLYAHMDQVPSREPVTPASIARAIELTQRVPSASDDQPPTANANANATANATANANAPTADAV